MRVQEIVVPEGEKKTLKITDDQFIDGSYAAIVHISKNASLVVEELIKTVMPCVIRLTAFLEGEGASVVDVSRYQGLGNALVDIERVVVHKAPATFSHMEARGVMFDSARALWRGRIVVEQAAKKACAFQRHDAILASKDAFVDAAPILEIFTHDVSCKHSASITRIQPEQVFYLKSRGVDETTARTMLLEGFLV